MRLACVFPAPLPHRLRSAGMGLLGLIATLAPGTSALAAEAPTALPPLQVTGTRLADPGAASSLQIDGDTLRNSGATSLGDALQSLPQFAGAPIGPATARRGSGGGFSRGIESVDLRGLGAQRTLVLLNGQRLPAGGNGTAGVVDLALIPLAAVARVDVYTGAAAVTYGADAVAGVVNIQTRRPDATSGLLAQWRQTDRGDGQHPLLSLWTGAAAAGGQGSLVLEWRDQDAVSRGAREFSARALTSTGPDNQIVPFGSSAPPAANIRTSDGRVILREGANGTDPTDFRPFTDADRFNFNPLEDLVQDNERFSLYAQFERPLPGAQTLRTELLWQQRDSATRLAPLPFFTNRLDGVSVAADNLYNPFGEKLSDVRRRLVEGGSRRFTQRSQSGRLALQWQGPWADGEWTLEASHGYNRVRQKQTGDLLRDRLALALGPSYRDAAGVPRCGRAQAPLADCVPLDLFGPPGSISAEMLASAGLSDLRDRQRNAQTVLGAHLRRQVGATGAGPVDWALGLEYRDTSARDIPAAATQAGNTTGAQRTLTQGGYQSREAYVQAGVPLWIGQDTAGQRDGRRLQLQAGLRGLDFSQFSSELVGEVGLQMHFRSGLHGHLSLARALRAPSVGELFGGLQQSNPVLNDACADFARLTPTQRERCVAQGVPADGSFSQNGNETPALSGGNPALRPERADITRAGLRWAPHPAWSASIDYYRIALREGIVGIGPNAILEQCLRSGSARFCERIARNPDGSIRSVTSTLQNLASDSAAGLDLQLELAHPLAKGQLRHTWLAHHVLERQLQTVPEQPALDGRGRFSADVFGAIPRWQAQYQARWQRGPLTLGYAAQYLAGLQESGGPISPGTSRAVPHRLYHDLYLRLRPRAHTELGLGVDNLADTDPPLLVSVEADNTDLATYQPLGRTLWLQLRHDW